MDVDEDHESDGSEFPLEDEEIESGDGEELRNNDDPKPVQHFNDDAMDVYLTHAGSVDGGGTGIDDNAAEMETKGSFIAAAADGGVPPADDMNQRLDPLSRREQEEMRKDRSLAELLVMTEEYAPIIPDAVTDYYLTRSGLECDDIRIKRLIALVTQKFIANVATDAWQYSRVRQQAARERKYGSRKAVLSMDDLAAALSEYGINIKKPDYFM